MKTPLTKEAIQTHIHYSWWKYLILVCVTIFGWNLIYTTTAYRPPEDKKVNLYVYGSGDQELMDAYLAEVKQNELSDMEDVSSVFMMLDETYGAMQLSTFMYAGEGDIYVLPKDEFQSYASQDVFVTLEDKPELLEMCEAAGIDLTRGWRRSSEKGERHLFGIPIDQLPGLKKYMYMEPGACMGVTAFSGNEENTFKLFYAMIRDFSK